MKCPKCNSDCRLKMTGAICLSNNCGWSTHNREVSTSPIGLKFKELEIEQITQDYEDMYNPFEGL